MLFPSNLRVLFSGQYFVHFVEINMQNTNEYLQQKKMSMVNASQKSSFVFGI